MSFEWCQDPAKVCLFWGVVLVLLVLVLLKLWKMIGEKKNSTEKASNRQFRLQRPYSSGATQRFAQENETPYLRNCIDYVYDLKAEADDKLIDAIDQGSNNSSAAADAAALASTNVDNATANIAATEYLTSTTDPVAHDGVHRRSIGHHEKFKGCSRGYVRVGGKCYRNPLSGRENLAAAREGPIHWYIGDNITQMKNEVSGQSPELDTNRWTMQIQNQVSDLRSDSVDDYLKEDILFRRNLANM